jgi:hypothetical protein
MVHLRLGERAKALETWRQGAALLQRLGEGATLAQMTARMRSACDTLGAPPLDGTPS